jgi:hypothetical protein
MSQCQLAKFSKHDFLMLLDPRAPTTARRGRYVIIANGSIYLALRHKGPPRYYMVLVPDTNFEQKKILSREKKKITHAHNKAYGERERGRKNATNSDNINVPLRSHCQDSGARGSSRLPRNAAPPSTGVLLISAIKKS